MKYSSRKYFLVCSRYLRFSFLIALGFATALTLGLAQSASAQRGGGGHGHGGGHFGGGHASGAARGSSQVSRAGSRVTYLPEASAHAAAPGARPFRGPVAQRTPIAGNFFLQHVTLRRTGGFFSGASGLFQFGYGFGSDFGPDCDVYPTPGCYGAQGYSGPGYAGRGYSTQGSSADDSYAAANAPRPMVIFYTRDGNGYGANDYWQEDGVVHLATTAGSEKTFPMSELDAKKTAEASAAHGVYFTLYSTPLKETGPQLAAISYTAPTCGGSTQRDSAHAKPDGSGTAASFGASGEASEGGVVVTSVQAGSLALQAGVHAGDTVTRIGCQDVHSSSEIDSALAANSSDTVWLSYMIHGSWLSEKPVKLR